MAIRTKLNENKYKNIIYKRFHLSPRIHGDQNRARVRVYVALVVSDSERMQNVGLVQVRQRQKVIRRLHRRRVPVAELDLLSHHAHPSVRFSSRFICHTHIRERGESASLQGSRPPPCTSWHRPARAQHFRRARIAAVQRGGMITAFTGHSDRWHAMAASMLTC